MEMLKTAPFEKMEAFLEKRFLMMVQPFCMTKQRNDII